MVFTIKQEKFEGPLELLLELIEGAKLSISEISLAQVTDEYIRHIRSMERLEPDAVAEFLVVAAQLMLVKSRSLLPILAFSEEEEQSVEELEKRLAEYKKIREVCRALKRIEGEKRYIVSREAYTGVAAFFYPPPGLVAPQLCEVFRAFIASLPKALELAKERIRYVISLEEKITHIRSFFEGTVQKKFSELVQGAKEKVEVIISFLALLELARQKFVALEQEEPFREIIVKKLGTSDQY